MRLATWNVNSLKARLDKVRWWLERARPDVLMLQETKLGDGDAPHSAFAALGYELAHHGEGRWNGVAIASKVGLENVVTNFGAPLGPESDGGDAQPLAEARMIAASTGGIRSVCIYAPNGRTVDSPFFAAKLVWYARLLAWLERAQETLPLALAGDFNVAPSDSDVWDAQACHGGTHVSPEERAAFQRLLDWGLADAYHELRKEPERYSWWDYRAGMFHKNFGMRIDHVLVSPSLLKRVLWADIDREARKGKPIPSDHAPVVIDVDAPGTPFDSGWDGAAARIAQRRGR